MPSWGLKISNTGQSVNTANSRNLSMSSKFPMFKIKEQGAKNIKMYKTTLSGNITNSQTTIPLTSLTGIPLGALQRTKYIWVYNTTFLTWEGISYPGTTSGSSLTGCTRGYKGTARASTSGQPVVVGYNEESVLHSLGYPPVHFVTETDAAFAVNYPASLDPEFGVILGDAWVTTSNLYISVEYSEQNVIDYTPSGTFRQHDFRFTYMWDSITTPYY
jgi:hypothetical protein